MPLGDHVYFGANENATGTELWRSDGTAAGTTLVSDIIPGLGGGFFSLLGVAGGSLYLSASRSDVGNEPFRVAPSGVVSLVSDIVAGTTGSSPSDVAEAGGTVYLSAGELLRTDGTPGGTTTIKDILPGAGLSEPSGMIATGSRLTFSARDGVAGRELWASDGTGAGTVMLADIFPGVTSSIGTFVGTTGTRALFSADNGVNGQELWSTDGTPGGTALLSDLRPGPEGSDPFGFDAFQRVPAPRVLFDADDGVFGLELWSSDGTAAGTRRVSDINPGAGSSDPELLRVLPDGSLLVSATDPAHGFEPRVFPSGSSFFFAEGTVRPGFAEYITLQNPGLLATSAVLSFQAARDDGAPVVIADLTRPVAANSRVTININDYVASLGISGAVNLSVKVTSPGVIGAERPVYFAADPALGTVVDGGHDVVGSRFPLLEWAFAEGTVRPGFVEYLTLQNPGAAGTAKLRYQAARDDGSPVVIPDDSRVLPANSRVTVNVNEYLASKGITGAVNLSVVVSADVPIVAERPVYFVADPALGSTVDGGTNVVGAREDADTWSFAEGTVRAGFVEYVTIQNPGGLAATATLTYQAARDDGSAVAVPDQSVAVPANSRVTINVNQYLADRGIAPPVNLSFKLTSTRPVVVERPIYFSADPGVGDLVEGGHDVVGTVLPATAWSLAEGTVRPGFVEYLTLQNPGDTATTAALAYQAANDAGTVVGVPTQTVALPARSRVTVNVNSYLTANAVPTPLNISVRVTSTVPIVVERPIYFVADPGTGTPVSDGHNVIGAPD